MALNPPISMVGVPLRLEGEFLMLERKHIEAEFKIPIFGKKTGKGKVLSRKINEKSDVFFSLALHNNRSHGFCEWRFR